MKSSNRFPPLWLFVFSNAFALYLLVFSPVVHLWLHFIMLLVLILNTVDMVKAIRLKQIERAFNDFDRRWHQGYDA